MPQNSSTSNTYHVEATDHFDTPSSIELYRELMGIAQEIELCRASL